MNIFLNLFLNLSEMFTAVLLRIATFVHSLLRWPGNQAIHVHDLACYSVGHRIPRLKLTLAFPYVKIVHRHFRRGIHSPAALKCYPVNGNGIFRSDGKFTIINHRDLHPPIPVSPRPLIISAALSDTHGTVDVTEEVVRLAGPRRDFFGFKYPLAVLTPWLCDRKGFTANEREMKLEICLDDTFEVHTYTGDDMVIF